MEGEGGGVLRNERLKYWKRIGSAEEVRRRRHVGKNLVEWAKRKDIQVELQAKKGKID